jgi:hypothetical protein
VNAHSTPSADVSGNRPLPPPAGAAPGIVAVAWPTGRLIYPYTPDELASGVDLYTRALKASGRVGGLRSLR